MSFVTYTTNKILSNINRFLMLKLSLKLLHLFLPFDFEWLTCNNFQAFAMTILDNKTTIHIEHINGKREMYLCA